MVTTLYLVRHGALEGGGQKRYNGSIDIPMSELGAGQIKAAASFIAEHLRNAGRERHLSYLRDVHVTAGMQQGREENTLPALQSVYCSDLSRAVRSAGIIAETYGLTPVKIFALRERSFGAWEGMTFAEIKEKFPAEFEAWSRNPLRHSPVGGETTEGVRDRAVKALDTLLRDHVGENVAVVAHGGINRIILCHVLGMPLENIFRIEQDYGAVNVIEFWEKYPVVKLINGVRRAAIGGNKEVSEGK
jgi:broad specificity phosphatase PhoE